MSAPPATRPIGWPIQTIMPQSASRHPSQFLEQHRPAASGPRVCVPRPPASTATTWWPFRPGQWPDLASGPDSERILHAQQGIAGLPPSPPARPAPGPSDLHRAAGSARIRSRPRPAPPPQGLRHWPTNLLFQSLLDKTKPNSLLHFNNNRTCFKLA